MPNPRHTLRPPIAPVVCALPAARGAGLALIVAAALLAVALPAPTAAAGPRRSVSAPTAAAADIEGRLDYVEGILLREQRPARWWTYGFMGLFHAAFVAQGTIMAATWDNRDSRGRFSDRRSAGIQFSSAGIGVIAALTNMLPSRNAERELSLYPRGSSAANAARLARAEQLLHDTYKVERLGRGPLAHIGSAVVATYVGVMLGVVFDLESDAALAVPMSVSVGVTRIYTMPVLSWRGWDAYQKAYGTEPTVAARYAQPRVRLTFTPTVGGVAAHLAF